MKKLIILLLIVFSKTVVADVWVNGYYRSNGTYVNGHYRSDPDGIAYNNWSYCGNVNPHTGKIGTVGCSDSKTSKAVRSTTYSKPTSVYGSVYKKWTLNPSGSVGYRHGSPEHILKPVTPFGFRVVLWEGNMYIKGDVWKNSNIFHLFVDNQQLEGNTFERRGRSEVVFRITPMSARKILDGNHLFIFVDRELYSSTSLSGIKYLTQLSQKG